MVPDAEQLRSPWTLNPYQYVNQNPNLYWDPDGEKPWDKVAARAAKWGEKALEKGGKSVSWHVIKRHIARNAAKWAAKTKFLKPSEILKLGLKTLRHPDSVVHQGSRILFQKDMGRAIGKGGPGAVGVARSIMNVVISKRTGKVITVFASSAFVSAAVIGVITTHASNAQAEVERRYKQVYDSERHGDDSWLHKAVDFMWNDSETSRCEDSVRCQEWLEEPLKKAREGMINELEKNKGGSLSNSEADEANETFDRVLSSGEEE
jgi:hypothetical protein